MKLNSFWRAMAGAGGQLREQGRDCVEGAHISTQSVRVERQTHCDSRCWLAIESVLLGRMLTTRKPLRQCNRGSIFLQNLGIEKEAFDFVQQMRRRPK